MHQIVYDREPYYSHQFSILCWTSLTSLHTSVAVQWVNTHNKGKILSGQ